MQRTKRQFPALRDVPTQRCLQRTEKQPFIEFGPGTSKHSQPLKNQEVGYVTIPRFSDFLTN